MVNVNITLKSVIITTNSIVNKDTMIIIKIMARSNIRVTYHLIIIIIIQMDIIIKDPNRFNKIIKNFVRENKIMFNSVMKNTIRNKLNFTNINPTMLNHNRIYHTHK